MSQQSAEVLVVGPEEGEAVGECVRRLCCGGRAQVIRAPTDHRTCGQPRSSSWQSFKLRVGGGHAAGGADAARGKGDVRRGAKDAAGDEARWRGHIENILGVVCAKQKMFSIGINNGAPGSNTARQYLRVHHHNVVATCEDYFRGVHLHCKL